ncbi:ABC transporter permease [Nocardioides sp.]|uniref:ABC transporter permease n=1 Tax=Nocardioides sp. TaxID=35761 RepID=UPI003783074C
MSALAAIAAQHGLAPVGVRPPLRRYVAEVWRRRHFAVVLASSKAYARNQGGYLGQLWAVLTPVLWACVYLVVFGVVLRTSRGVENFPGFLVIGVFLFHFSTSSISNGSKSITGNSELIGSLEFPRALLPIAAVMAELFTLLPALAVMLAVVPLTGEPVQASWLLLAPAVTLQWVFGTGVAFVCARLVADHRDLGRLVPFVLRVLMYTSGVFFAIDHYVRDDTAAAVLQHQPIAVYLDLGRAALLEGVTVGPAMWLWGLGWALLAGIGGFWFFWRAEERYARG